jgi:cytosine/adenosine deaminase-related metal-dependent hydrolase
MSEHAAARPVNAHTHLYSGLAPLGLPAPDMAPTCFLEILERVWWRLDRALDGDSLCASARYYAADALRRGCVGLIDHHESPNFIDGSLDVIADECERLGMPAVLCYGATERNGGRDEARAGLAECRRFLQGNQRRFVRGAVGLHASFTVSDDTIRDAANLARELGTVLHLHIAEDVADVEDARRRGYEGVVDRLAACDALVEGSVFAHGVHLQKDEVSRLTHSGIWLVQNPRSNKGNQVGYPSNLVVSPSVALGTDGFPAAMDEEAAALLEEARAHGDELEVVAKRPARSAELIDSFFDGETPPALPAPDDDTFAGIEHFATAEALNLWQRMRTY